MDMTALITITQQLKHLIKFISIFKHYI